MKAVRKQNAERVESTPVVNAKFVSKERNFLTCLSLEFGFFLSKFV